MKHNFSVIREVLQDAADVETHADNERAMLTGRDTPNQAFVALEAIEARVAELELDLIRERVRIYEATRQHWHGEMGPAWIYVNDLHAILNP